ncbi:MAG TPA: hypothetical protein VIQ54_10905 [Polyangia bacterium]|jgi:hypothetical protein
MVAAIALAASGPALAHGISERPIFPVEISATQPGTRIHLFGPEGFRTCGERCLLALQQAWYKLVVTDPAGERSTQNLFVSMPTAAAVTPPDRGKRNVGLALMGGGLLGIVAGGVTFYGIAITKYRENLGACPTHDCTTHDFADSTYILGAASLAVGLALGVAGLLVWQRNYHASVRVEPLGEPPVKDGARLRLTPAAGQRWAGLGLTGRF